MTLARYAACAFWILSASPSFTKELVYLTSGFQLEVRSHTETDQTLVLQTATGTLELPIAAIARIEPTPDDRAPLALTGPSSPSRQSPEELLRDAAIAQGLPPDFVRSVALLESAYHQKALSPKGALGLMQLMPGTAADLGVNPGIGNDNAKGGAKYLRNLLLLYKGDAVLALAAYNAGPGAVARFGGVPPYQETRRYVDRVLREFARAQKVGSKRVSQGGVQPSKPISTN